MKNEKINILFSNYNNAGINDWSILKSRKYSSKTSKIILHINQPDLK